MRSKQFRLWLQIIYLDLTIAALYFLIAFIISICIGGLEIPLLTNNQKIVLNGDGYAVTGDNITKLLEETVTSINKKKEFIEFSEELKIYQKENEYRSIKVDHKKVKVPLNSDYPIMLNHGAYLYLYHSGFTLINDELQEVAVKTGTYLSRGMLFNQDRMREESSNIILLQLPNGYYMNTQEFHFQTVNTNETIEINSVIRWDVTGISYCSLSDPILKVHEISATDSMTMINCADKSFSYDAFYERLIGGFEEDTIDKCSISDDLYQYFLGYRYDYMGNKICYRSEDGYFMKTDENQFFLYEAPLYYTNEQKLLLPCDYVLIQPKLYKMSKMPAMTEITYEKDLVYTSYGKKTDTLRDFVLFDGAQTYIFFNDTDISWGDEMVSITPMSSVIAGQDGSIEIYQYDSKKQLQYFTDGYQEITATINNKIKLNLSTDILYRPDGQEQILFSEPSMLKEAE